MSKIRVNLDYVPVNGKQLSFIAPCSSADVDCLLLNGVEYALVDSDGVSVARLENVWNSGAIVSVILNTVTHTAFIQNANTNTYIEGRFLPQTQKLKQSRKLALTDSVPFYIQSEDTNKQVTLKVLKDSLGIKSASISVLACEGATVTVTNGPAEYTEEGSFLFTDLNYGFWTVTATLGDVTVTDTVNITDVVIYPVDLRIVRGIALDAAPSRTSYYAGESFDRRGLKVTAMYADSTTEDVTDECVISPSVMQAGVDSVTVSYTCAGITVSEDIPVHVRSLTSIEITEPPIRTSYAYGEIFSISGMVVTAVYDDGETREVAEWTHMPTRALNLNDTLITVYYVENGVEVSCTQEITVKNVLVRVDVVSPPKETVYLEGQSISTEGMVIRAVMADGTQKTITGYVISPTVALAGTTHLTIAYTEDGVSKAATQEIVVKVVDSTLQNNDWDTIRRVSDAGQAANYWSIGDRKTVVLKGTVNGVSLDTSIDAFIIGFDHNGAKEGSNRIHFQIGKTGNADVSLHDGTAFYMNATTTNAGGWAESYMRKTTLGNASTPADPATNSLLSALPVDLLAVIKSVVKYTTASSSAPTDTEDYLWLLSEFEVHGKTHYSSSAEKDHQAQYDYYKAGNSKVKYQHTAPEWVTHWWNRSPATGSYTSAFCSCYTTGGEYYQRAEISQGISPGFCV